MIEFGIFKTFMEWNLLFSGIIGALLATMITAWISWRIFIKRSKIDRYTSFIEHIDSALILNERIAPDNDTEIKNDIELHLNIAYSMAMVSMDDKLFKEVSILLNNDFDKKNRNRIYWLMRKDIFGYHTKISFDEIIGKFIKISKTHPPK